MKHFVISQKYLKNHDNGMRPTGYIKSLETVEYLGSKAFLRKMFQTKLVKFKKIYSLITSVWSGVALSRSDQGHW